MVTQHICGSSCCKTSNSWLCSNYAVRSTVSCSEWMFPRSNNVPSALISSRPFYATIWNRMFVRGLTRVVRKEHQNGASWRCEFLGKIQRCSAKKYFAHCQFWSCEDTHFKALNCYYSFLRLATHNFAVGRNNRISKSNKITRFWSLLLCIVPGDFFDARFTGN